MLYFPFEHAEWVQVGCHNLYQEQAFANDNLPERKDTLCCRKKAILSKIPNPFSHIKPENVCSRCLCAARSVYVMLVQSIFPTPPKKPKQHKDKNININTNNTPSIVFS